MNPFTPTYKLLLFATMSIVINGCSSDEMSDAYGQFEAVQTTISSETGGKLIQFRINEGDRIKANQQVGLVDTSKLVLRRQELEAQLEATQSRITNINAQIEVQQEQLEIAKTELNRIQSLVKDQAATQKQLDDAQGQVRTLQRQIHALETQKASVRAEVRATRARIDQLDDQIQDARIINPINGTVLTTYVEPHELVQAGQPLYQIASMDTLDLRIYISGAQLPAVKIGQRVQVLADKNAEANQQLSGSISWIASEAEFTPRMIQTKEERVTQVYAVKVRVPNPDGILKIGMPGEVNFGHRSSQIGTD